MSDAAPDAPHLGWVDARSFRRASDRAAVRGGERFLAREVERRMAERLAYIRHAPARILAAGCDGAAGIASLRARYPAAEIVALDVAPAQVAAARAARSLGHRLRALAGGAAMRFACGDVDGAALRAGACDMLWSNLALAWSGDAADTMRGWGASLAPGGLAMFSTFGPDTLRELAEAFAACDQAPHVHPFTDMHDIGDALVAAGFGEPVIDMEMITLTYAAPAMLLAELRTAGWINVRRDRRRTLTGRARWQRMIAAYAAMARDGRVPATFEIVYGHAWKAAPRRSAEGHALVRFDRAPRHAKNR